MAPSISSSTSRAEHRRNEALVPLPPVPLTIEYNPVIGEKVCRYIAEGYSLKQIARVEGFPNVSSVLRWVRNFKEFAEAYKVAQDIRLDMLADEILEIADDTSEDFIEKTDRWGNVKLQPNQEHITRARLRVEVRKWLLTTLKGEVYGDRLKVSHSGVTAQLVIVDHASGMKTVEVIEDRIRSEPRPDDKGVPEVQLLSKGDNGTPGVG